MSTAQIREYIRHSDLANLEQVVLDGHGHKLIGETGGDGKIRAFIKSVPSYMVSRVKYINRTTWAENQLIYVNRHGVEHIY